MGNATSKAARKLPKRAEPTTWTSPSQSSGAALKRPLAGEKKDQAIEDDARDPHFMSNLSRLGAVKVDHHMQAVRPHQKSREMIESRIQSEQEAASMHPSRNHVQASTLTYLLDKSKSNASRQDIKELANKYGVDIEKIEKLSQHVTSPSINPNSVVRKVRNEDGEEELSVMAIWIESRALKA
ncbi:hypothetical protein DFJ43DRAFT_1099095 [Lentinula guzmanii]|uniref:Uncharacterized protein n=1 Tax=Lentinula guzmanii TaxID=2804957 RepID=A0AA38MWW3_9AGAR|nr:hypothetical protein DFJ43DRAFT_1099095 [Lentinula guzmanii]